MTRGGRILAGAALGIVAATLAWPALFSIAYGSNTGMTFEYMLSKMPEFFVTLLLFAGPGALVLSCLHTSLMARWAPRARTKGQIRTVGILLGILLGIANLMLVLEAVSLIWARGAGRGSFYSPAMAPWLIPAAAGGAGAGLGVTLGLQPGLPEET